MSFRGAYARDELPSQRQRHVYMCVTQILPQEVDNTGLSSISTTDDERNFSISPASSVQLS